MRLNFSILMAISFCGGIIESATIKTNNKYVYKRQAQVPRGNAPNGPIGSSPGTQKPPGSSTAIPSMSQGNVSAIPVSSSNNPAAVGNMPTGPIGVPASAGSLGSISIPGISASSGATASPSLTGSNGPSVQSFGGAGTSSGAPSLVPKGNSTTGSSGATTSPGSNGQSVKKNPMKFPPANTPGS